MSPTPGAWSPGCQQARSHQGDTVGGPGGCHRGCGGVTGVVGEPPALSPLGDVVTGAVGEPPALSPLGDMVTGVVGEPLARSSLGDIVTGVGEKPPAWSPAWGRGGQPQDCVPWLGNGPLALSPRWGHGHQPQGHGRLGAGEATSSVPTLGTRPPAQGPPPPRPKDEPPWPCLAQGHLGHPAMSPAVRTSHGGGDGAAPTRGSLSPAMGPHVPGRRVPAPVPRCPRVPAAGA